jgi:chitinase
MTTSSYLSILLVVGLLGCVSAAPNILSVAYCGFGGNYCGESINDDVYSRATHVLLAYAVVTPNGAVSVDADHFPKNEVNNWRNTGKKIWLSVGGPNNQWINAFSSESNRQTFLSTLTNAVRVYNIDGVDLDLEDFFIATPNQLATTLNDLRRMLNALGRKYISVSVDCIDVYQGSPVPSPDESGKEFNFMVPVIRLADSAIDFYNVKAYSNWYDGYDHNTVTYLQDVYLNWRNLQGFCKGCLPIPDFKGVPASKLIMGVLASPDARAASEYKNPTTVRDFKTWLLSKGYDMYGFQVWNSYWDRVNGNQISQAVLA